MGLVKNYMTQELVSVIITTRNSAQTLEALLISVKNQTYRYIETILVDNSSTDNTKQIAYQYTKRVYNKGPERSVQRNFGVSKSNGKYVFILDSDMELGKNVIKNCVKKMYENQDLGALIVPEKSFGVGFWAKCKAFEREFYVGDNDIEAARFFKKTIFLKFKGYDLSLTGPEDWDLPLRMRKAGVKIGRIKDYILHNERKFSIINSAKKKFYYASHAASYLKRHPEMITTQGNLLFRAVFFRKWKKLLSNPTLALGMFFMRFIEMTAAMLGFSSSLIFKQW